MFKTKFKILFISLLMVFSVSESYSQVLTPRTLQRVKLDSLGATVGRWDTLNAVTSDTIYVSDVLKLLSGSGLTISGIETDSIFSSGDTVFLADNLKIVNGLIIDTLFAHANDTVYVGDNIKLLSTLNVSGIARFDTDIFINGANLIDSLNANTSDSLDLAVRLIGNQTISGVKTFNSTIVGTIDSAATAANADTILNTLNFDALGGTASDAQIPNNITIDFSDSSRATNKADTSVVSATADTILNNIPVPQVAGLTDSLATFTKFADVSDSLDLAVRLTTNQTVAGEKTFTDLMTIDSINIIGQTLPHKDVNFGGWIAAPEFGLGANDNNDTTLVIAEFDTITTLSAPFPVLTAEDPDTSSQIQFLDVFSPVIEVPFQFAGVDSIVFEFITGLDEQDSSTVKLDVYEYNDGVMTFQDSTTQLTTANVWEHDATLSTFANISRYSKFIIKAEMRTIFITAKARLGRMKIYWKEGS